MKKRCWTRRKILEIMQDNSIYTSRTLYDKMSDSKYSPTIQELTGLAIILERGGYIERLEKYPAQWRITEGALERFAEETKGKKKQYH